MPATQPYVYESGEDEYFRLEITDDLERGKNVYFMDQDVKFEFSVLNTSDSKLEIEVKIGLFLQQSSTNPYEQTVLSFDVSPGKKAKDTFHVGLLPYQGTGVVGLAAGMPSNPNKTGPDKLEIIKLSSTRNLKEALHTFVIYDRDYYRVNYLNPRRAQYIAAVLTVGIILVGVMQIVLIG